MKINVVAPVHMWNDVRVYERQIKTLLRSNYKIIFYNNNKSTNECNIHYIKCFGFNSNRFVRILSQPILLYQLLKSNSNTYLLHNPDTLIIGLILKLLCNKTVVYDTHEDFSLRIDFKDWIPKSLKFIIKVSIIKLEYYASKYFDHFIYTQTQIISRITKNSTLINNSFILKENFNLISKNYEVFNINNPLKLVYVGSISKYRGIGNIIESLVSLRKIGYHINLDVYGRIPNDLKTEFISYTKLDYINFHGFINREILTSKLKNYDIGLLYIDNVGDHCYSDPNKIYEYAAHGLPFIASNFPSWQNKFGFDFGFYVQPSNSYQLCETLSRVYNISPPILNKFSINAINYIRRENWDKNKSDFLKIVC